MINYDEAKELLPYQKYPVYWKCKVNLSPEQIQKKRSIELLNELLELEECCKEVWDYE